MVKQCLFLLLTLCMMTMACADDDTVQQLDDLEQQRVILQKQLEISKLQKEINDNNGAAAQASAAASPTVVATENLVATQLQLIKVVGLASQPRAVFLYNGYRLSGERGQMILPNIQVRNINETYVLLKDTTTGQESVLWLSAKSES